MKSIKYLLKLRKHELGVVINALNREFKKQSSRKEVDERTTDLLLRLLAIYETAK